MSKHIYWQIEIHEVQAPGYIAALSEIYVRETPGGPNVSGDAVISGPGEIAKLFDGSADTFWMGSSGAQIIFAFATPIEIQEFVLRAPPLDQIDPNTVPKTFTLAWSDDNIYWHGVDAYSNETNWGSKESRDYHGPALTAVPYGTGTAIGDMTADGGLASAFDGVINHPSASAASKPATTVAYIGKDWGAGGDKIIAAFAAYGINGGGGFGDNPKTYTVTMTLQGSSDNFSVDINDLGSTSGPNFFKMYKHSGIDTSAAYRYHRLKIEMPGAANDIRCSEVEFFEATAARTTKHFVAGKYFRFFIEDAGDSAEKVAICELALNAEPGVDSL